MLPRNVLIFHAGALGDFLLTFPLALALCRVMPQSRVYYVTHGQKAALAENLLGVHAADVEAGWGGLFGHGDLAEKPARLLAGGQLIVDFTPDGRPRSDRFAPYSPAPVLTLPHRPADDHTGHVLDAYENALAHEPALANAFASMRRHIETSGLLPGRNAEPSHALLHPGSGGRDKCWPVAQWCRLASLLRSRGLAVTMVLGETERDRLSSPDRNELADAADALAEPQDLNALATLMATAGVYVGHDTGPTHLAAMLGVPSVALFGPASRTAQWHPLGPAVTLLQASAWADLTPEAVAKAAETAAEQNQPAPARATCNAD
ncbi:MAG: glycosyltransferase family 9 protein [Phycisphaerae bacterium]